MNTSLQTLWVFTLQVIETSINSNVPLCMYRGLYIWFLFSVLYVIVCINAWLDHTRHFYNSRNKATQKKKGCRVTFYWWKVWRAQSGWLNTRLIFHLELLQIHYWQHFWINIHSVWIFQAKTCLLPPYFRHSLNTSWYAFHLLPPHSFYICDMGIIQWYFLELFDTGASRYADSD